MKRHLLAMFAAISLATGLSVGCSQEVSHTESDKPRLLGGHVHEEETTVKNPDGTYSTEKKKVVQP